MIIQWYGQACFKILTRWIPPGALQSEEVVFCVDPFESRLGLTPPRGKADVVLITHDHWDHNNTETFSGDPFIIRGPGEYETKGVYIQGIASFHDTVNGKERGLNTIYTLEYEGLRLCHMGDFGQNELSEQQLEAIGDVDILMVPVGGVYTIDADEAAKIVHAIEPAIVIPMHYGMGGLSVKLEKIDRFLKLMGAKEPEKLPRLTIKKKDIDPEETKVVLLQVGG